MTQNFSMGGHPAWLRRAALLFLVALLSSCNMARLGYNNGETISYFWLNSYVGFDADQKPWVKKEIGNLFAWHRRTQLPDYIGLLTQAQKRIARPVTEAELARDYEDMRRRVLTITDRAAPSLADLALALRPEQIVRIQEKFDSSNETFRKEHLRGDLADRQRQRFKRTMKQAEHWFGNFSGEQERQIRVLSDARPLNDELVLADRMQRQAEMIRMLQRIEAEKPTREAAAAMIRQYVSGTMDHYGHPEYQAYFEKYRAAQMRMVAGIINMTTAAQKENFTQALQGWVDDFQTLSRLDPAPAQRFNVN
ncbi:DUF6279 family lipoprotein [Noviherbaspirillum soli]|uniref:DUF6279 family lipoprotein n=1 Tax=Noviherbaspirillum soli TaxID=1064518 RepID=UPI001E55C3C4|nr:DUF6279 family lipoprotein [Noviherbaspirillum soli]